MEYLFLVLIGILAGSLKGASGFGSSLIAVPLLYLAGYTPAESVTMMITCNIILNILLIYENKSYFHLDTMKKIYPIILGGVIFTAVGLYLISVYPDINPYIIELVAAGLIVVAIINKLVTFEIKIKDNFVSLFTVGVFSGLGNGLASMDGPPVVLYLLGINSPKRRFKSTLATHFLVMGVAGVLIQLFNGVYTITLVTQIGVLFTSLVVGLVLGMFFGGKLNEEKFQRFVLVILIGLAVSLLIP